MIDIHSHILPGIDDGAQTEADSLAMAQLAVAEGIHTIVATPHHKNGSYHNARASIEAYTTLLNQLFEAEGIALTVLPGQETRLHGEMIEGIEAGDILPINGSKYVFVELPHDHVPQYTTQMLFDIQVAGLTPVIVHPERNQAIMEQPNRLYDLVRKGTLTQITAGSLVGKFGKKSQHVAQQLIEANLTHFIASDAHNATSRQFWMKDAFTEVANRYGSAMVHHFQDNSAYMIQNENIHQMEPTQIKRRRFLGLF